MRRPAAFVPIVLALGAIILAPLAGARADGREEGLREIEKCQTIDQPGSYRLVNDLTFSGTTGTCLAITADSVTIDLAGFTITGPGPSLSNNTSAIAAGNDRTGIAVRNGSISGFDNGVDLEGNGSIVEGLRVFSCSLFGIIATGIVRGPLRTFATTFVDRGDLHHGFLQNRVPMEGFLNARRATSATLWMRAAARLEVLTGLALIVAPSLVARFLFGSDLNAPGVATGRISGW